MKLGRLISVAVSVLVLGCGGNGADEVLQAAQGFWDAAKANDLALAETYVSESSVFQMREENDDGPPGDVQLGSVEIDGGSATVQTTISNTGDEAPFGMDFETFLVRERGEWKVDMDKTTGSMMRGAFAAMAEAMGNAMAGLAEGMAAGMSEALKEGFAGDEHRAGGTER